MRVGWENVVCPLKSAQGDLSQVKSSIGLRTRSPHPPLLLLAGQYSSTSFDITQSSHPPWGNPIMFLSILESESVTLFPAYCSPRLRMPKALW